MTKMTPIESEFATSDEAAAHDAWFRTKVEVAIGSGAEPVAHDRVMADMRRLVEERRNPAGRLAG